ncbi:uncharacterized protein Z520_04681 [Fonsecaea multimorphosa CBS 102226]|uniref:Uncharacterized protein n=1 Tax=Fonsecaea multimorphosa CBS 102226 TaxID=1442371 RepID=A0A0D2K2G9_9EURO|nr:uncharacterized protein Z520_04681 [Fonsecaea multimorphosa CBS 102226]KIY00043.1 hypothetical protein Z520_04681 [Fonsecaea multimorphosa CBS 102226]OAL26252.1 hypothetical protein AYO22_04430 [Fonsecaea multimorphosa]
MAPKTNPGPEEDNDAPGTHQTVSSKQCTDDQQQPRCAAMPRNDANIDGDAGNPSTSPGPATDLEKRDLIARYAELFCGHFSQFRDPLDRMEFLNSEILGRAKFDRHYLSIWALHADYDLLMSRCLVHSPDVMQNVGVELNKFASVQGYWWPKCVNLPTQVERLAFVDAVFERIKAQDFDMVAFQTEYEE